MPFATQGLRQCGWQFWYHFFPTITFVSSIRRVWVLSWAKFTVPQGPSWGKKQQATLLLVNLHYAQSDRINCFCSHTRIWVRLSAPEKLSNSRCKMSKIEHNENGSKVYWSLKRIHVPRRRSTKLLGTHGSQCHQYGWSGNPQPFNACCVRNTLVEVNRV